MRKIVCLVFVCPALVYLLAGCLSAPARRQAATAISSSTPAFQIYHDPSLGWTASIPTGWVSCHVPGGQFSRGLPTTDPTKLILWTYDDRSTSEILAELVELGGVIDPLETGEWDTSVLQWVGYRGGARSDSELAVEWALAAQGGRSHLVLLVAKKDEVEALVNSILLPVVDSFLPGLPDPAASVLSSAPPLPDYWPTHGWRFASPESQGMDEAHLDALVAHIRREDLPIDSVTVIRHGYIALDVAFSPYQTSELHDLHSVTKSITSTLVGMALQDQELTGDTPVLQVLSPWHAAYSDTRKQSITVEHLLTMTAGLDWKEWGAAYETGTGNDLVRMVETAPDWTQYILDRPMIAEPGKEFLYNSGASYLLSTVVSRLTGKPAADFAEERLFTPLGIRDYAWQSGPEGVTAGWGNLRMRPHDLARIGLLYLHRGKWDGQQIIPPEWVTSATRDHVFDPTYEYGYQWWLDAADGYAFMSGRFGQTVIVAPRQDMVVVMMASLPEAVEGAISVPRWLAEKYLLTATLETEDE